MDKQTDYWILFKPYPDKIFYQDPMKRPGDFGLKGDEDVRHFREVAQNSNVHSSTTVKPSFSEFAADFKKEFIDHSISESEMCQASRLDVALWAANWGFDKANEIQHQGANIETKECIICAGTGKNEYTLTGECFNCGGKGTIQHQR